MKKLLLICWTRFFMLLGTLLILAGVSCTTLAKLGNKEEAEYMIGELFGET